jgi:shikimate dehydrogenase
VISGATRLAAVIGHPIRHSLSPAILNAAFGAAGLDWAFVACDVAEGDGAAAVAAMRALGLGGLSVTMPHKAAARGAVDEVTAVADALGAVNCVFWRDARLVGDSTDGAGFVAALAEDPGLDVAGLRCVLVGAGGAGLSVARALGDAGAADVAVLNRSPAPAARAAALAGPGGRVGSAADVAAADLVVNATSLGMGLVAGEPLPVDPAGLHAGQVVADLVYHPQVTPLLAAAAARGARPVGGLGMLVHQAALAFTRWTGHEAPVAAMAAAARTALSARGAAG